MQRSLGRVLTLLWISGCWISGCGAGGGRLDAGPPGGSCAWIRAETPTVVPDTDAVTVYCQTTTDCLATDLIVTTLDVLNSAEAACKEADTGNSWSIVANACVDDSGLTHNAVRCWSSD